MRELTIDDDRTLFDAPESVKELLHRATLNWEDTPTSEKYIRSALKAAPDSLDVSIAAYRYFFYKQQYQSALQVAEAVVDRVRATENLPENWELLKPILINKKNNDPNIRLYLNAYVACGFVLTKLQQFPRAREIFKNVKEIDNLNEFGGRTMLEILEDSDEDED